MKEIALDADTGLFPSGFDTVAAALHNEWAKIDFLSRPRRFGKSLFLDTLKELFEGNESLFDGLDIHACHDWSIRHPVLRLSFGYGDFKEPGYLAPEPDGAVGRRRAPERGSSH